MNDRIIRTDITMQVVARDREVHMLFNEDSPEGPKPAYTPNFFLSADQALALSALLADLAFEADTGLKAAGPAQKAELIERHRVKLVDRLTVVLNSQREKKTVANRKLARQVVDIVLADVFDLKGSH